MERDAEPLSAMDMSKAWRICNDGVCNKWSVKVSRWVGKDLGGIELVQAVSHFDARSPAPLQDFIHASTSSADLPASNSV
jgi:hypothetical protein